MRNLLQGSLVLHLKANGLKMAKKRPQKKGVKHSSHALHPETKTSVWGIVVLGLAVVLTLAAFDKAGPVGELAYNILERLLGWGYYLVPAISILVGLNMLTHAERALRTPALIGASFFVAAGLSIIDIIYEGRGGLVGEFLGNIERLFGSTASLVINFTLLIISVIVSLNAPLKLKLALPQPKSEEQKGEESKETKQHSEPNIIEPEAPPAPPTEEAEKHRKREPEPSPMPEVEMRPPSKGYVFPPLSLLKSAVEKPTVGDLRANANIIKRTLEGFGIQVEMGEITIGPKVTRYTLKPAEGVKLSRIVALSQDLSLALAAHPIRIEAPIPGRSLVGIEVPNRVGSIVRLGSLLAYPDFKKNGYLSFPLGRDVAGEPVFANLSSMPHLLIAGATGSGKSVTIHSLVLSLLYKNSPETLRFIMIDPKRVELSIYDGIPHLVAPVITEGKKAIGALRFAIHEMETRYEKLLAAGNRDIISFNKGRGNDVMPYLVVIIDELADLMTAFGREVESAVVRLAQMARATGIHLIVSTQRPSVEVITGLIKANITSRIALQVASQIDSRTILDTGGAEKLLGGGDMLFISSEHSKPKRIQGSYITEEEVRAVANFIREKNPDTQTANHIGEELETELGSQRGVEAFLETDEDDELYAEALEVVRVARKASASLLQRRLRIGYARAARLLDIMEERGVIGPQDGAKPREVYLEEDGEGNKAKYE